MKILKIIFSLLLITSLFSCGNDDDICTSGEATPRIKMKFKTLSTGKMKTLDTLYVDVDYGKGPVSVVNMQLKADSVLLPLRVDDYPYTDIYVKTGKNSPKSKIRLSYKTQSEYVSPACGIKKLYENLTSELITPNPVVDLEKTQTQIVNESKTHLYLLF